MLIARDESLWFRRWVIPVLIALLVAGGGFWAFRACRTHDRALRMELLAHADAISRALSPESFKLLSFSSADRENPVFQRLDAQMSAYAQAAGLRGLYTMMQRDGQILFGPESYATNDPQASPPGTVYQEPSEEDKAIFHTGRPSTFGPQTDEYGTFVTAVAPVLDPNSGEVVVAAGVDVEARDWQRGISNARLLAIGFTLVLVTLILAGYFAMRWRAGLSQDAQWRLRHLEAAACALVGVALSLGLAYWVHDAEAAFRKDSFAALARAQAAGIAESLGDLTECLDDLGNFLASRPEFDAAEFQRFVAPFVRGGDAQAWEWIPAVPAAGLPAFEQAARREGLTNFTVFQLDDRGARIPVSQRDVYYPVRCAQPFAGNELALGLDVGSEPNRRASLLEAARTGLLVATEPLTLVQAAPDQQGIILLRPVYGPGPRPGSLRGFAAMVLRLDAVLRQSLRLTGNDRLGIKAALFQLRLGKPPRLLASTTAAELQPAESMKGLAGPKATLAVGVPFFLFGASEVIHVQASAAYLANHPLRQGYFVGGAGLLVTAILTGFVSVLVHRRALLQRQVWKRTRQLQESDAFQRSIMESLPAGVVLINPENRQIESVNPQGAALFGAPLDVILGRRCHGFLCPASEGACPICDQRQEVDNSERLLVRADGSRLPILKSVKRIVLNGQVRLLECFVDISDRKRAEAALRESETNFRAFFETITDLIVVTTPEGRILYSNSAVVANLGYPQSELAQMQLLDLFTFFTRTEAADQFAAMLRGEPTDCQVPLARKDHTLLPAESRVWRGRWNGADCLFCVAKDRSVEVEAQQRFEVLFRCNPALMALSSLPERRFVDVNNAFLTSLGYTREEVLGRTAGELELYADLEDFSHITDELRSQGRVTDFEFRVRRKDGSVMDGLLSGGVVIGQGRQHFLTVITDLSARKRAEEQLRATLSELERLNRVMMNREQRVLELKREVNQMRASAGLPVAYPSAAEEAGSRPPQP